MNLDDEVPGPDGCATPEELVARLRSLRLWAGQPSLRQLRRLGGTVCAPDGTTIDALPPTTVSAILHGRRSDRLPRLPFVETLVTACLTVSGQPPEAVSAQVERWQRAWRRLAAPDRPPAPDSGPGRAAVRAVPVPRQLPIPVGGFVGREAALATLDRWSAETAALLVTGPAGYGKSALAVHWGHRVARRYPDGQLYTDLGGTGRGRPADPDVVLAGFLRALGVGPVPPDAGERAALYRSALADRRVLVLLDDAASAVQVRPLLPGSGTCTTVVTGRDDLAELAVREGAPALCLAPLTRREAAGLVARILHRAGLPVDTQLVTGLAEKCGGSPLALRMAAERLVRHRQRSGFPALAQHTTTPITRPVATGP